MLDQSPNYSVEPDWTLQSSQVSDSSLICVLVKEYYSSIARLTGWLLMDSRSIHEIARETIYWAVANRHRFWGSTSLRAWLYGHVFKASRALQRSKNLGLPWRKKVLRPPVQKLVSMRLADQFDQELVQAFTRLNEKQQILLLLDTLEDLSPEQKAGIIGNRSPGEGAQTYLTGLYELLASGPGNKSLTGLEAKTRLTRIFQEAFPLQVLTSAEEEEICSDIETQIAAGWRKKRFSIGSKELAIGGIVVVFVIVLGLAADLMAPAPPPIPIKVNAAATMAANNGIFATPPSSAYGVFFLSTDFPSSEMFTPTPISPRPPVEPLTMQSSLQDIEARMEQSSSQWSTLYAEALIVDYGPKGYIGPPQFYRNRLWFSQPAHLLALAGRPDQNPDYARIVINNNYFEEDMTTGVAYYPKSIDFINSQRASSVILSYALSFADRNRLYGYYLTDMLFPYDAITNASQIQLIGIDSFNGRKVLILRWVRAKQKEQIWVDAITGLVLGWRTFASVDTETIADDVFITTLALDINFPNRLYSYRPTMSDTASWADLWTPTEGLHVLLTETDILKSANGRGRVQAKPAPPGFNPSDSSLSFAWHTNPDGSPSSEVSLTAGEYDLGTVSMGDPWSLLCTRSPDGSTIAFIEQPDIAIYAPKALEWFRLQETSKVYPLYPDGYTASDVAFSPDSQQLAFFGCSKNESDCGVFILNLVTLQRRKLANIGTAAYFAWKPDGQELAMLGTDDLGSLKVIVINVNTGKAVYTGPINWKTMTTTADSPTRSWGVTFPALLGGLEDCVSRPLP